MKFFKLYTIAALALASVAFTGCDDNDDFTPGAQSAGAYFNDEAAANYEIEGDVNSVTFDIYRSVSGPEATFTLNVENPDASIFDAPASVTFAADEATAPYTITFDPAKISDGESFKFTITLPEGTASNYGAGSYTFSIGKPEAWESIGKGLYTDDIACSLYNIGGGKTLTWEVEIQQSCDDPRLYRLVNPYAAFAKIVSGAIYDNSKSYDISFRIREDNSVVMTPNPFATGLTLDAGYGMIYGAQMSNGLGTFKDGVITFPTKGFGVVEESELGQGWYPANSHGAERIVFPGVELTDYSAEIDYAGYFTAPDGSQQLIVNVAFGADVEKARVAAAITTDVQALINSVVAGEIDFVEVTKAGEVRLPSQGAGEYIAVVVSYGDGEPQLYAQTEFEIVGSSNADDGNWTSLGDCDFIDGWFNTGMVSNPVDALQLVASVEIQKSEDTPGHYRLMAPFTNSTYAAAGANAVQKVRNIVIDCSDPAYCVVTPQRSGWGNPAVMGGIELYVVDGGYLYPALGVAPSTVTAAGFGSSLTVDEDGISIITINNPMFGSSTEADALGYGFLDDDDPLVPTMIMFVEDGNPAAQAALKKKVIGRTIGMLSGKVQLPVKKTVRLAKKNYSKSKYVKKGNGIVL